MAWGNGTTGTVGTVSAANSLVGSNFGDGVGGDGSDGGVTALPNGNYIVDSPDWNNFFGAVTWGNGTTGVTGAVSSANSLVGSNPNDTVGFNGVTVLTNGNYVVASYEWSNDAEGAATWGSGTAGVDGVVSAANSLIGSTSHAEVGSYVTALTNGNYVVSEVGEGGGAATWGNGTTGIRGTVSATNSLVGNSAGQLAGGTSGGGLGGVTALSNGNYVVDSPGWNSYEGAVTWGNGTTGIIGTVSADNSLVGRANINPYPDDVGIGGVTALTNGNYVVDSPDWSVKEGAATWGNGTNGTIGIVSAANSLVGTHPADAQTPFGDRVGSQGVTALTNGNYVVDSPNWNDETGAATWGNGTMGTVGTVSAANSLVGSYADDQVGGKGDSSPVDAASGGVTALTDGNYVVASPFWSDDEGAATWGNGTTGVSGTISAANSLVGSTQGNGGDQVGSGRVPTSVSDGVTALPNGNYFVFSPFWNQSAGAVTWGNGTTGSLGTISSANSLIDLPGLGLGSGRRSDHRSSKQ